MRRIVAREDELGGRVGPKHSLKKSGPHRAIQIEKRRRERQQLLKKRLVRARCAAQREHDRMRALERQANGVEIDGAHQVEPQLDSIDVARH